MLCIQHSGWNDEKQPLYLSCGVYSQERKADINCKRIKPTNITILTTAMKKWYRRFERGKLGKAMLRN